MRLSLLLVVALVAGLAGLAVPSAASAREYPWCAVYGGTMSGSSNCGFTTRQQCLATVSGIGGSCEPNQIYTGSARTRRCSAHFTVTPLALIGASHFVISLLTKPAR
jgi:hypothetical protein